MHFISPRMSGGVIASISQSPFNRDNLHSTPMHLAPTICAHEMLQGSSIRPSCEKHQPTPLIHGPLKALHQTVWCGAGESTVNPRVIAFTALLYSVHHSVLLRNDLLFLLSSHLHDIVVV